MLIGLTLACAPQKPDDQASFSSNPPGAAAAGPGTGGSGAAGPVAELVDRLGEEAAAWQDDSLMVGAEVVVIEGRAILFHRTYGWADREDGVPMTKNTVFRIRSMTKPLVATAVLLLQEQGRLDLDDRVADYLPAFDNQRSGAITIRQLLAHTAGFLQTGFPRGSAYEYASLAEAVRDLGATGPQHAPGEQYIYSDGGSATLAYLVEVVTGRPCEDVLRSSICEPLGLDHTYCAPPPDRARRAKLASTYLWDTDRFVKYWDSEDPQEIDFFRGSGGAYATPLDYARFLYAWSHPQAGFLSEETKAIALESTPHSAGYALHWEIYHRDERLGLAFGHGGSDGTLGICVPARDLIVLCFTQSRGTLAVSHFQRLVFQTLGFEEPVRYEAVELTAADRQRLLGRYAAESVAGRVYETGGRLRAQFNEGSPLRLVALSKTELAIPVLDAALRFEFDEQGKVRRMTFLQGDTSIELRPVPSE